MRRRLSALDETTQQEEIPEWNELDYPFRLNGEMEQSFTDTTTTSSSRKISHVP